MADETKPAAKAADSQAPAAIKAPSVTLKPGPKLKCIVPLAGGIYLRPDGPTTVTADQFAKLSVDVGFKRLLAAGTVLVVK